MVAVGPGLMLFGGAIPMVIGSLNSDHSLLVGGGVGFGAGLLSLIIGGTFISVSKTRISIKPRPGTPGAPPWL